jgi:hypothetical protein
MNTALVLVLFIVLPKESGETPATPRLGPKPQRSQKNINLPMETGPIILHQRHALDVLPVGGDSGISYVDVGGGNPIVLKSRAWDMAMSF